MPRAGVDDEQSQPGSLQLERNIRGREVAAVDEEGLSGTGSQRGDLVHRACGYADELVLGQTTDPQPDVAVVPGKPGDYTSHPTTAALVIEVCDTTFRYDTTKKLAAYAAGGIADYWVLEVNGRQLHVFRDPAGDAYATHQTLGETEAVSPLAAPAAVVRVADLLP